MASLPWRERLRYVGDWAASTWPGSRHWPALIVLLAALGLRLWNTFPTYYYGDDAEYAIVATYLRDDWRNLAYPDIEGFGPTPFVSQPPLLLYLFAIVGHFIPDMELAATLVCLALGSLTSVIVYAIGVQIQGRTMGVIAGLFLAVMPYHVLLSRKAYLDVGLAFFMALTILFFILWLDRRTATWAVLTGLAAGATILSKLPGVLILAPLGLGLLIEFWHAIRIRLDRLHARLGQREIRSLSGHAMTALVPLLLLAGLYLGLLWYLRSTVNLLTKLGWQWGRVASSQSGGTNALAEHPWHWYLTDPASAIPAQGGILMSILAVSGIVYLLRGAHKNGATANLVLVFWFLAFLAFLSISHRKEWFYIVPLLVPLALLAAAPVRPLVQRLTRARAKGASRGVAGTLLVLLLLTSVVAAEPARNTLHNVVYKPRTYGYGHEEAAAMIHSRDPNAIQIGSLLGRYTLHFYNGQRTYHWFVPHALVNESIERGELRYVVIDTHLHLPYEEQWMRGLVSKYNGTLLAQFENHRGNTKVWLYELNPSN